jgi:hypothetical protein
LSEKVRRENDEMNGKYRCNSLRKHREDRDMPADYEICKNISESKEQNTKIRKKRKKGTSNPEQEMERKKKQAG